MNCTLCIYFVDCEKCFTHTYYNIDCSDFKPEVDTDEKEENENENENN